MPHKAPSREWQHEGWVGVGGRTETVWDQTAGCQIENLTAGYGEGTVLTGLDLEVPRGAITEIIEHRVQPVEPEPGLLIAEWDSVKMTFRAKGGDFRVEIVCQDATMLPDLRTDISIQIG